MQLNKEVHKLYINSGYWHQTRLDFKDKKHPLLSEVAALTACIQ